MGARQIYLGKYLVGDHKATSTGNGLVCGCSFEGYCKHIRAAPESLRQAEFGLGCKIMERPKLKLCPKCSSGNTIRKEARHNKNGDVQRLQRKSCNKKFGENLGFERSQFDGLCRNHKKGQKNGAHPVGAAGRHPERQLLLDHVGAPWP